MTRRKKSCEITQIHLFEDDGGDVPYIQMSWKHKIPSEDCVSTFARATWCLLGENVATITVSAALRDIAQIRALDIKAFELPDAMIVSPWSKRLKALKVGSGAIVFVVQSAADMGAVLSRVWGTGRMIVSARWRPTAWNDIDWIVQGSMPPRECLESGPSVVAFFHWECFDVFSSSVSRAIRCVASVDGCLGVSVVATPLH